MSVADGTVTPGPTGDHHGTWHVGPFDNDDAADFAIAFDEADVDERGSVARRARTLRPHHRAPRRTDHLGAPAAVPAVSAAAPWSSPSVRALNRSGRATARRALPEFPSNRRTPTGDAAGEVVAETSELAGPCCPRPI
ncbi:DUF4259 domain-containing protein [Streptomyces sp. NPDC048415]|uniref:DUF4259 domain-containing protein n=1 Tax=Streptomyces sp. NPDC048415 TaxID=3154822 RepID=UPI0034185CA1